MLTRNHATINALLKISRICGIFPTEKPSPLFYTFQILVFALTFSYGVFCLYNNFVADSVGKSSLDIFMQSLSLSLTLLLGLSLQLCVLSYPERWRNLYKNLRIDSNRTKIGNESAAIELLFANLLFLIKFVLITYGIVLIYGVPGALINLFRPLVDYYIIIYVLMILHVNSIIKGKFTLMNIFMRRGNCVKHVQRIYIKTTKLIDNFNDVFGNQILIISAHTISYALESFYNTLKYCDLQNTENLILVGCGWFNGLVIFVIF